uniref:Uncharacterized protein n=1 Tax=Cucumis melo TaxID=3656 RepID=A0A9I9CZC0_CUCME
MEVDRIRKGRYRRCLSQEGLGYSNLRTYSSVVPSRDNNLSLVVRDGYGEVVQPLKKRNK